MQNGSRYRNSTTGSHALYTEIVILLYWMNLQATLAETETFKKYMELSRKKTVIFVTHRISVAALAERILVFDNGKIIEEGTHANLLKHGGKYAKLYNEQAKWYNR